MVNLQKTLLCPGPGFARQIDTLASSHIPLPVISQYRAYVYAISLISSTNGIILSGIVYIAFNFHLFNFGVISDGIVQTWSLLFMV